MKQFNVLKSVFFVLLLVFVSSCKDDDVLGEWDAMEWKYQNVSEGIEVVNKESHTEIVVNRSGSLDIVCKNYKGFWLAEYPDMQADVRDQFSTEFCDVTISGNKMHCEFHNVSSQDPEEIRFVVTAGDIFHYFNIVIN